MIHIQILHTPGCGHTPETARLVRGVVARLAVDARVVLRDVARDPVARDPVVMARFAGSPTVLVDGRDLEPDAAPVAGFS